MRFTGRGSRIRMRREALALRLSMATALLAGMLTGLVTPALGAPTSPDWSKADLWFLTEPIESKDCVELFMDVDLPEEVFGQEPDRVSWEGHLLTPSGEKKTIENFLGGRYEWCPDYDELGAWRFVVTEVRVEVDGVRETYQVRLVERAWVRQAQEVRKGKLRRKGRARVFTARVRYFSSFWVSQRWTPTPRGVRAVVEQRRKGGKWKVISRGRLHKPGRLEVSFRRKGKKKAQIRVRIQSSPRTNPAYSRVFRV